MKLEAKNSPRVLQMPRSGAHQFTIFLALFCLLTAGFAGAARAADDDPLSTVKTLAKAHLKAAEYAAAVAKLVKLNPKQAESIITEAVKDEPPYACDVVKACILALTPANATPDPKLVASIVANIVQNIQANNPELIEQIISCALDVAKDAGPDILNALAGLYNGPNNINRPPATNGGLVAPGVGAVPTPFHKPLPTPNLGVTPVVPI